MNAFCHTCCDVVTVHRGSHICPHCYGRQLEYVADIGRLQREIQTYLKWFATTNIFFTQILRSPPNVQELPQPLIIVNGLIQGRNSNSKEIKTEVNTSLLEQVTAVSTETEEDQCHICLEEFKFADKLSFLDDDEPCQITTLKCGHTLHYKCALRWFKSSKKNECSLCKQTAL